MKPARYIFLNQELSMSSGKCAAQAAHAETLAMQDFWESRRWLEEDPKAALAEKIKRQEDLFRVWYGYGHYAKYVMRAENTAQMYTIERYLDERDFDTYMVIDEGHTEGTYFVPTAMAVELVDKDDERTASIFAEFRRYKDARGSQYKRVSEMSRWEKIRMAITKEPPLR